MLRRNKADVRICRIRVAVIETGCHFSASACDVDVVTKCGRVGGVMDGRRCFFVSTAKMDYNAAWNYCQSYGARVAQVHTTSEATKISDYLKVRTYLQQREIVCLCGFAKLPAILE